MNFSEYRYLVLSDLYRRGGNVNWATVVKELLMGEGWKYSFWMRTCAYTRGHRILRHTFYPIAALMLRHYKYVFGIDIPFRTAIGPGFYIGHFSGIFVNHNSRIGRNCNISQGVTLGEANRGRNKGAPVIGDDVYIGPGAKIVGAVKIGNRAAIGANAVVTRDVPDDGVAVGSPARVISSAGSKGYVEFTDYDAVLRR